jgi:acyl-CoA reductase-like NAD-dependent aldehyde dehydrogenase
LNQLADALERHGEQLAVLETLNVGKPIVDSRVEVKSAIEVLRYFAGFSDKLYGRMLQVDDSRMRYHSRRQPLGVCALITSYNYPLLLAVWKLAPALACGNVCLLKPHQLTPLSTLYMAHLIENETDMPADVVQVLPGDAAVGQRLSEHRKVDKLSFTGSLAVGRRVLQASAATNLKRVTLELGGKSSLIVFKDADIDEAVEDVTGAMFCMVFFLFNFPCDIHKL